MTLLQELVSLNDEHKWTSILEHVPSHLYTHTYWYNYAMHCASKRDVYLYVANCQDFWAICPISPRVKTEGDALDVTTPYGFSGFAYTGKYENFTREWYQFMQQQGFSCGHIALHPLINSESICLPNDLFAGKSSYILDLTQPVDMIIKNFSTDHRHRLRQWQKLGYRVNREKTEKAIQAFVEHYAAGLEARNAAAIYDFGELAWGQLIMSPYSYVFSVEVDNVIEAVAFFISYNNIVDYYMIASSPEGRAHARGILLDAITYFHEQKQHWLHLGCGVRAGDALEQFKARFGAKPVTTYALKQVYDLDKYNNLCAKYGKTSNNFEGYFPAYWSNE